MLSLIIEAILYAIACILFRLEALMGEVVDMLYEMFLVFAGCKPITVSGEENNILNLFFENDLVSTIYWGMAMIGIVLTFGFAVVAVVKKMFDLTGEKVKATYGMIIANIGKAIILMLVMTLLVSATIQMSCQLLDSIDTLFNSAEEISDPNKITFTDEDYATMFRIFDKIGNCAINPGYDNRFTINSCYNEIRTDMLTLQKRGVFKFMYEDVPSSWQYALAQIYLAGDLSEEIPLDVYDENISSAINFCIDELKYDASFKPISEYTGGSEYNTEAMLGRIIMISASFRAADNSTFNTNASIYDEIRKPFYVGTRDIYDKGDVEDYFSIDFGDWNHLIAIACELLLILQFLKLILNCIARVFNIIILYITAPGFISVLPLDDGGKLKQWTTAFVIQSLSIFGSVICVRLMVMFVPIIMSGEVVLFQNDLQNILAKDVFVIGICFTAQKASAMISGILADNAGYQSIMAGDVGEGLVQKGLSMGAGIAKAGLKVAGKGLGVLSDLTGLSTVGKGISDKAKNFGQVMRDRGGIGGALKNGFKTNAQIKEAKGQKEQEKKEEATDKFRADLLGGIGQMNESFRNMSQPQEINNTNDKFRDDLLGGIGQMNESSRNMSQPQEINNTNNNPNDNPNDMDPKEPPDLQ